MNIFDNVLNGKFSLEKEEVITESSFDIDNSEYITEAVYCNDLIYLKTLPKKVLLPKGQPLGKGCMCYLYTSNTNQSIKMMNNESNFKDGNKYFYYFYNPIYKGSLATKRYRQNLTAERKELYKKVSKEAHIQGYNKLRVLDTGDGRNMYYDLSKYIEIFFSICNKLPLKRLVNLYWLYLQGILEESKSQLYKNRFILVDISNFKITKTLKENVQNPLFMIYYTLYRYPLILKEFDMDFYFYTDTHSLRINPSKCDEKAYRVLRVEMNKLMSKVRDLDKALDEKTFKNEEASEEAENAIVTNLTNYEKPAEDDKEESPVEEAIKEKVNEVKKTIDDSGIDTGETSETELKKTIEAMAINNINEDKELIEQIYTETKKKTIVTQPVLSARDKKLKEDQKKLKVNNMTVEDLQKMSTKTIEIPKTYVEKDIRTPNENMKTIKFENFDKTYNEKVMPKDITDAVLSLNNKSIPMFLRDVKVTDTSDELNYKDTYTFYFEDANRQRSTVKVDIPKFVDDKFLYLGGNKKTIKKQEFLYPVVKTSEDTVQIVTNYNKMFIRRVDTKSVSSVERLKKLINTETSMSQYFTFGNASITNKGVITTIEYDELGKILMTFTCPSLQLWFKQSIAKDYAEQKGIKIPNNALFVGITKDKNPIFIDTENQKTIEGKGISKGLTITDLIINGISPDLKEKYGKIKIPKRLMYAKVTVMDQDIGLMLLICFWEGLSEVLKKADIKYQLVEKLPQYLKTDESYIQFSDCIMVYSETASQSLLINGLRLIDTTDWKISDMDSREPYIRYFITRYGTATIANALMNFYEFVLDPITIEVLNDINLPTDLVKLIVYAVNLLADSQYTLEINQGLSRIRSNEIIPAILYESLAKAYVPYRNANGKKKFSIPQDIVIKKLLELKTL